MDRADEFDLNVYIDKTYSEIVEKLKEYGIAYGKPKDLVIDIDYSGSGISDSERIEIMRQIRERLLKIGYSFILNNRIEKSERWLVIKR